MHELRDPLTLAIYGLEPDTGLVCVEKDGKKGKYALTGEWRSGDHIDVCPQMCLWVGGPNPQGTYATSFRQM